MSAPIQPRTAAATAAVVRRGDESAAARLRRHGWLVVPPERLAELTDDQRGELELLTTTEHEENRNA